MSLHRVIISLGSSVRQTENIDSASKALSSLLAPLTLTHAIWTDDIHGRNIRYLNRLASGYTTLTVDQLNEQLKHLEQSMGRTPQHVTIDLDLMQYDDQRYHQKDWPRPYIQQLINEIL